MNTKPCLFTFCRHDGIARHAAGHAGTLPQRSDAGFTTGKPSFKGGMGKKLFNGAHAPVF
jgi:hypothetical protein